MIWVNSTFALATLPADYEFLHGSGDLGGATPSWLSGSAMLALILLAASSALASALVLMAIRRDRSRHGPTFRYLARALGVDMYQRRLLARVASVVGVPNPGSLLMSRGCYDKAVTKYTAQHGGASQLGAIRRLVFE